MRCLRRRLGRRRRRRGRRARPGGPRRGRARSRRLLVRARLRRCGARRPAAALPRRRGGRNRRPGSRADRRRMPRRRHCRQLHDLVPHAGRRARGVGGARLPSSDLGSSLDAVCERLGVNTDHDRPSRRDEAMARGLAALGWHVEAMPRDVLGCEQDVVCGSCGYGCPLGAKQSTLRTWLEDAAGAGARIVVGAKARRVLVENGSAAGVDAGPVQVRCRAVVAAAGAIETPALLLRSGSTKRTSDATFGCTPRRRSSGSSTRRSGRGRGRCRRSTRTSFASSTAATASSSRRCRCIQRS